MIDWTKPLQTTKGERVEFLKQRKQPEGDPFSCAFVCLVEKDNGLEYVECFNVEGKSINPQLYGELHNVEPVS